MQKNSLEKNSSITTTRKLTQTSPKLDVSKNITHIPIFFHKWTWNLYTVSLITKIQQFFKYTATFIILSLGQTTRNLQ